MLVNVRNKKIEVRSENFKWKILLSVICFIIFEISANAQCAMCRAALTSEGNVTKAEAINDGIVYLMTIPYILVAALGYYIYRMKKKR